MGDSIVAYSASSAGSNIFAILALLVISLVVLLILRYFLPIRTTPAYLIVPIFFALFLPASIVILVPIDLASSSGTDSQGSRGIWLKNGVMLVAWRVAYWLSFALTWFILPLLGEFVDSGYRSPEERMRYSIRSNIRYQLIYLGCGGAGMIYFFISSGASLTSFKALVISLAYFWGLALAIYLMGYGLVAIPREMFRKANIGNRLRRLQAQAPSLHDRRERSIQNLENLESQISQLQQRKSTVPRNLQEWVEDLDDMSGTPDSRLPSTDSPQSKTKVSVPSVVTEQYLADLGRKLSRAQHAKTRFIEEWSRLVSEAALLQAILDSSASKRLELGAVSPHSGFWDRLVFMTPYMRHVYYVHVIPALCYFGGGIASLASVSIVWSELTKKILPKASLISPTIIHHSASSRGQIGLLGQLIAAAWLSYMCLATLTSISAAKVWGNRALVRRNTYAESACWYSMQIARLTVPLAYNFLTFLPRPLHSATTFYGFLGRLITDTPLGESLDYYFPITILIPVTFTLFGLYGRVKACFGFAVFNESDDDADEEDGGLLSNWREGADLIERDLAGGLTATSHPSSSSSAGGGAGRGNSSRPAAAVGAVAAAAAPTLWIPPASSNSSSSGSGESRGRDAGGVPSRTAARRAQQERMQRQAVDEEENVFEGFAHRVRNTFDGIDRPKWMDDVFGPSRRDGDNNHVDRQRRRGGDEASSSSSASDRIGRWFGGRPREGELRL